MSLTAAVSLLDALRAMPLLRPAQLQELERHGPAQFPDARALAQHLLARGWLTPFQINQLLLERGQELVLGPYILLERLGEGSGGQVFKARHQLMNRTVALRLIRPELLADPDAIRQFYAQVEAASKLDHENVIHAYDAGPIGQTHFLASEYIAGTDMHRLVTQTGPLPISMACSYIYQAALGLQHGFEHGLMHGELKPSKLIVTQRVPAEARGGTTELELGTPSVDAKPQDRPGVIKVIDIGVSRLLHAHDPRQRSGAGASPQSGSYRAPESLNDGSALDIRTDTFSLGRIFYFLLAGQPPTASTPRIEHIRPETPPAIAALVARMTASAREDRCESPLEVAQALQEFVCVADPASDTGVFYRAASFDSLASTVAQGEAPPASRRRREEWRWLMYTVLSAMLLLAGVLIVFPYFQPASIPAKADNLKPGDPAEAALLALESRAKDPKHQSVELWQEFARFRMQHAGTQHAADAAAPLARLPSPLERIDAKKISAADRAVAGPLKELVAVLGDQRWRSSSAVHRLVYRPDGKVVAAANRNQIVLWDAATGVQQGAWSVSTKTITGLVFTANGKSLVSAGLDKTVKVWDPATGKVHAEFVAGHELHCLAVAPNGELIAAAGNTGFIHLWNVPHKKELTKRVHSKSMVVAIAFSPDSSQLVSGGQDGHVKLWNVADEQEPVKLPGHEGGVLGLAFSPDGKLLASAGQDKFLRWTDRTSAKNSTRVKHESGPIVSFSFAADGRRVATAGTDGNVKIWDVASGKQNANYSEPDALPLSAVAFAPDGQSLVASSSNGNFVRQWNLSGTHPSLTGHTRPVTAIAFAPDGMTLASISLDDTIRVWDIIEGKERLLFGRKTLPRAVAFAPDGRSLASGGDDKTVKLWDVITGNQLASLPGYKTGVHGLDFSPDGQTLVTVSGDPGFKFWDLITKTEKTVISSPAHANHAKSVALAPDGRKLFAAAKDKTAKVWNLATGAEDFQFKGSDNDFSCVAYAANGQLVAAAGAITIRLWDPVSGRSLGQLTGHKAPVTSLAFSLDGQALASADAGGVVILWKVATAAPVSQWQLPGSANAVAFAPDSRHLAIANQNGTVYILRVGRSTIIR
jgi:WD40 repeat protein/serine/threonine protein kinase